MKNTGNIALVLCIAVIAWLAGERFSGGATKKIGVVQMEKLVYDFKGMKEASRKYELKMNGWGKQSDSLENRLRTLYSEIRLDSLNRDKKKLERDIETFMILKRTYAEQTEKMRENAAEEDKQMTIGVINQINEYMKAYAVEEGYAVILCNSEQQSVGHADEKTDITEKFLEYANKKYEGSIQ